MPECANCGGTLRRGYEFATPTGATHVEYRCPDCGAEGARSANMPGGRGIVERGQAFTAGSPLGQRRRLVADGGQEVSDDE